MGPARLTARLRRFARDLGFDAVGCAPAGRLPEGRFREWLRRDYHGSMQWMERGVGRRLDPEAVLAGARSVVSLGLNYGHSYQLPYDEPARAAVSRYAAGDDYHDVIRPRLRQLLERLQTLDPSIEGRYYVDTGPVADKVWAARAGLGWIGKHTNLLSTGAGSWFFLADLLLNAELEYDEPVPDRCGSCTACIEACPTDAIVEAYVLDSRRCISYLTIEHRDDIDEALRPQMANLVFGCDICQDVCPWNRRAPDSVVAELAPRDENRAPELSELADLKPEKFAARFRKSALKRAKWRGLMRNVAIAIGNSGDPSRIADLEGLLNCADAMVRRHAVWAVARLGGPEAGRLLQRRLKREVCNETRETIERALGRLDRQRDQQGGEGSR